MKIQIFLDRTAQSPAEKDFVRGLIAAGIPDVDTLVNFNKDHVVKLIGMSPDKLPMLEELLLREGLYVGMSVAELEFAKLRVLPVDEIHDLLNPPPLGLE